MYLFTSEVVNAGHSDKCADIVTDTIVDILLKSDKNSRVANEVFVVGNKVVIGGEIKSSHKLNKIDYGNLVKNVLRKIGCDGAGHFSKE